MALVVRERLGTSFASLSTNHILLGTHNSLMPPS